MAVMMALFLLLYAPIACAQFIDYPNDGCGCAPASTHYPTVALSQMAYGSSMAFGPGCGRCFNITLLNSFTSSPPFFPNVSKSIVVKVTDLCPLTGNWCSATTKRTNKGRLYLNFDLAWPSPSVPEDFFPSDPDVYGFTDFGVWNISYSAVSCNPDWEGSSNSSALGAVSFLGSESVCCPADPFTDPSTACQSYSELNGIPPEATPGVQSFAISIHTLCAFVITVCATPLLYTMFGVLGF